MLNKKDLFSLPDDIVYLNNSYMSPSLKSVEQAGLNAVVEKNTPFTIKPVDFFNKGIIVKKLFSKLIDTDEYHRIAVIPSVSYGIANVTNNIHLEKGDEILIVENQFPSNIYSWQRLAEKYGATINCVQKNDSGKQWNEDILNAINSNTKVVSMSHVHWSDGTLFDLKQIRAKTLENDCLLIIDGTQSVGALPFSVKEFQPDALICAAYKWLLGPYSIGLAYYGSYFDNGVPIEENWSNRLNSEDFSGLTNYESQYKVGAHRYSVGESANFILIPMLIKALEQLIEWKPITIQEYAKSLFDSFIKEFEKLGCAIEQEAFRSHHLIGLRLPKNMNMELFNELLEKHQVYISKRGEYIRIAIHVYNTEKDLQILLNCISQSLIA